MINKIADLSSYTAAGGTVIAGYALSEVAMVVGMVFIVLTYFTGLYFKLKDNKKNG